MKVLHIDWFRKNAKAIHINLPSLLTKNQGKEIMMNESARSRVNFFNG